MPNHRRGPWSTAEDEFLLHLVRQTGANNWVQISQAIGTRSPKQCRERFHQNLKPTLNHDPITEAEGQEIERLVKEMGKRWAEIARRLKGRSDNAVKNWWNGGVNRRKRAGGRPGDIRNCVSQGHVEHSVQSYPSYSNSAYISEPLRQLYPPPPSSFSQLNRPYPLDLHHGHRHRNMDTPLPSPSSFSVASAEGAPSLISDCSSSRSPPQVPSPTHIQLPPLTGSADERRNSVPAILPLNVPGYFASEETHYTPYTAKSGDAERPIATMASQRPLPSFESIKPIDRSLPLPSPVSIGSFFREHTSARNPSSMSSPYDLPPPASSYREPVSPQQSYFAQSQSGSRSPPSPNGNRDLRMEMSNLLSR